MLNSEGCINHYRILKIEQQFYIYWGVVVAITSKRKEDWVYNEIALYFRNSHTKNASFLIVLPITSSCRN